MARKLHSNLKQLRQDFRQNMKTKTGAALSALMLLVLSNCNATPEVSADHKKALFAHDSTMTQTCNGCHEKVRPAPVAGYSHGASQDCVACHVPESWKTLHYTHRTADQVDCNQCHLANRPAPVQGHIHYNALNCTGCHLTSSWKDLKTFDHQNSGSSCISCHVKERPATHWVEGQPPHQAPGHYGDSECSQCHIFMVQSPKSWQFQHEDYQANNLGTCMLCHEQQGRRYHLPSPEFFQQKYPDRCVECHVYSEGWEVYPN